MVVAQKRNISKARSIVCGIFVTTVGISIAKAEIEVYGQIRLSIEDSRQGATRPVNWKFNEDGNVINQGPKVLNVGDRNSRLGLYGKEELESFTLLYHLEWGFDATTGMDYGGGFTQRLGYLTLKNDLGALTVGKIENPFKQMLQVKTVTSLSNGNWNSASMSGAGDLFQGSMGSINNFNSSLPFQVGHALLYTSPEWNGLNFDVSIIMSQKEDTPDYIYNKRRDVDIFTGNINYFHTSGAYIKGGYITGNTQKPGAKAAHVWGISIGYVTPQWGVNFYGITGETKGLATFGVGNERSQSYWANVKGLDITPDGYEHKAYGLDFTAFYMLDDNLMTKVYGSVSYGNATKQERNGLFHQNRKEKNRLNIWAVGFEHKLSGRTKVWAEYQNMKVKQTFTEESNIYYHTKTLENNKLLVGLRHDF